MTKAIVCLLAAVVPLAAESEFWPGAAYAPEIPTLESVVGHKPGEQITRPADIVRYMQALAAAASTRMRVFEYARTWEGRPLIYAVIGSEANIAKLPAIQAQMKRLADPRATNDAEAKRLMSDLPALVWLAYGVHGNEISSPDAAMLTAYHLLAARNDPMTADILAKTLVFLNPLQNPDGRERFVQNFEQNRGLVPDPSPLSAERVEPWPGGRTNHYNFDMNRDWFALTQPETRGHIRALREWLPVVFVDLHEMGSNSTYYFAPEADPFNPHLTREQRTSLDWFGKNNAKWFDQFGFQYFTREVFDAFYPGYGASWPEYYGAIAMTYEQASSRGLMVRREDDTILAFRDTVRQHFVASLSTCETAAKQREALLANFYQYRKSAVEEGKTEPQREFILVRKGDVSTVDHLADLLVEQGVEVRRASAAFQSAGKEVPAGSYLISLAQPSKRLIRTLLDPQVSMPEKFVKEQERRRARKLPGEIYDVTAWSLPLLFNVELLQSGEVSKVASVPVAEGEPKGQVKPSPATVAYLVPWGTSAAGRFLAAALRANVRVYSADKPFTQGARRYPGGTLIVPVKQNGSELETVVAKIAAESGAEVQATDSGWVDDGINFGSEYVVSMRRPAIALAWDRPVNSGSAGQTRFVLERQFGYPVSVIRTQSLGGADLSRFQVIILPDGSPEGYASVLGERGARRLKDWVSTGGTLIAYEGAMSWMADPKVGLLAVAQENVARPPAKKDEPKPEAPKPPAPGAPAEPRVPGTILEKEEDYLKAIRPENELPDGAAGVLLRAKTDPDSWLTAGVAPTVYALLDGPQIFSPIKLDKGVNAAVFADANQLLASGYLWEENRKQLAFKPLVVLQREGRGSIIGFTADPNYRAYLNSMNVLFLNAVFRSPAHSRPATAAEAER